MRYTTQCGPGRYDLVRGLGPLELPRCEAPQVKVDFVAFGIVVVTGKLQLVFQLVLANGFLTDAAEPPDAWPAPDPSRLSPRQPSSADGNACELAERRFIGHGVLPNVLKFRATRASDGTHTTR